MANLITSCRILLSLLLLFFPALSPGFYGLYLAAGLSDMLDGFVARRTNSTAPWGQSWTAWRIWCFWRSAW